MNDPGGTVAPARAPARAPRRAGAQPPVKLWGLLAEFETPAAILEAADRVRAEGYRWWDCHTPFFVHGLDKAMGVRPTILPWLVFFCGLTGATLGYVLQWYTNAEDLPAWFMVPVTGYKFLVSGKPMLSLAVYAIVMFELTVLISAIGTLVILLLLNKLPWLYHPLFTSRRFLRATDDRFFIAIEARDPLFYRGRTEEFLRSLGATAVEAVEA